MYVPIRNNSGKLKYQCDALKGDTLRSDPFSFVARAQAGKPDEPSLEDFVGSIWPHGIPIESVQKLTDQHLSQIRKWIAQNKYEFWPNSVTILGLRGSNGDIDLLQKVLESKSKDPYVLNARINVPRALGMFAYRTNSKVAFDSLTKLLSPHYNHRNLGAPLDGDALALAQEATQGIAIFAATGNVAAQKMLEEQMNRTTRGLYDLGVGQDFYEQTDQLRISVEKRGLIEGLRPKN
jgi:hypothetical protein